MDELEQLRAEVKELRLCVRALAEAVLWSVCIQQARVSAPATSITNRVTATLDRRARLCSELHPAEG